MNAPFVKKLVCLVLLGVMAMFASGCDKKEVKQKNYQARYELSDQWKINEDFSAAILNNPQKAGTGPFVKIEGGGLYQGTSEDAKKEASKEISGDVDGEIKEEMIGNKKVYILQGKTEGEYSGAITSFYFESDGWVIYLTLYDDYEYYKQDIERMLKSFQVVEVE